MWHLWQDHHPYIISWPTFMPRCDHIPTYITQTEGSMYCQRSSTRQ
jgi:hypothetical protein